MESLFCYVGSDDYGKPCHAVYMILILSTNNFWDKPYGFLWPWHGSLCHAGYKIPGHPKSYQPTIYADVSWFMNQLYQYNQALPF